MPVKGIGMMGNPESYVDDTGNLFIYIDIYQQIFNYRIDTKRCSNKKNIEMLEDLYDVIAEMPDINQEREEQTDRCIPAYENVERDTQPQSKVGSEILFLHE